HPKGADDGSGHYRYRPPRRPSQRAGVFGERLQSWTCWWRRGNRLLRNVAREVASRPECPCGLGGAELARLQLARKASTGAGRSVWGSGTPLGAFSCGRVDTRRFVRHPRPKKFRVSRAARSHSPQGAVARLSRGCALSQAMDGGQGTMSTMEGSGYSAAQSPAIEGDIPTLEVVQVVAKECRPAACEMPLHIGLFFDGTGNNYNWKEGQGATQEARHKD